MEDKDKNEKPSGGTQVDAKSTLVWSGILIVYLALFCSTGYVAFFAEEWNPAVNYGEIPAKTKDPETKALILEELKRDSEIYKKRRELAAQSFNVVLGALLGFLSASATSVFGRKEKT
ncbi:hypothetical protein [Imhoffiella purpurea]|uniref:hypothetical protein n=1 Tax=Imhoffiella purpurea TaxID=1249627 RepID=UPI0012FD93A6|nr:hypothetical protein [Imhoffiella purpurea]